MQSWTLGFLCYNEEESITKVLDYAYTILPQLTNDYEIIVVNDGSKDNSLNLIEDYKKQKQPSLQIINHEVNKGIGAALVSAYKIAKKENVLITCGDGQFDIAQLIPYKEFENKHVLCFYRINNTTYSIKRNYLSAINKYFNQFAIGLNLKDVNWAKVYKNSELKKFQLELDSSLVETEICAKLKINGNKFIEIESKYLDRIGGQSKGASLSIVRKAVFDMLKLIFVIWKFKLK